MSGLAISDVVNVQVSVAPDAITTRNFGAALIVGSTSSSIGLTERMRVYSDLDEVGDDFQTTSPEYLAAENFFGQSPQPSTLYIGYWNQTGRQAVVLGAVLTAQQQQLSNFTAITAGNLEMTIDAYAEAPSNNNNFSQATSLTEVAAIIEKNFGDDAIVQWNADTSQFFFSSYGGPPRWHRPMTYPPCSGSTPLRIPHPSRLSRPSL